MEKKICYKAKS